LKQPHSSLGRVRNI